MSTKKKSRYNIETTDYWRFLRQGHRETHRQGHYSRRKRMNDMRWGARNNIRMHGSLGRCARLVKGHIRAWRLQLEHCAAVDAKLKAELANPTAPNL